MIDLIEQTRSEATSYTNIGDKSSQLPLSRLALLTRLKEIDVTEMRYQADKANAQESYTGYYKTGSRDSELLFNPAILMANLKQIDTTEMRKDLEKPNLEIIEGKKPSKEISTGVPSWVEMRKSVLMGQLQELLHELEAMQQAGGGYPIAYIINISMSILSTLSTQMQELTAKPLEHFQEISKRQAIVQEKIEAMKRKVLADPDSLTKEDMQGLKDALNDLDKAVAELEAAYTFEDNEGNKIVIWPNDEVKDIYDKAKANVDMMQGEEIIGTDGKTLESINLDNAEELFHGLKMLTYWAESANLDKPKGALVEWDNGKDGAQGNSIMKIILDTEISTYTDKLNRDAQLLSSAQSMGQKQVEHAGALMRGIIGNFISR